MSIGSKLGAAAKSMQSEVDNLWRQDMCSQVLPGQPILEQAEAEEKLTEAEAADQRPASQQAAVKEPSRCHQLAVAEYGCIKLKDQECIIQRAPNFVYRRMSKKSLVTACTKERLDDVKLSSLRISILPRACMLLPYFIRHTLVRRQAALGELNARYIAVHRITSRASAISLEAGV